MKKPHSNTPAVKARELIKVTAEDRRYVKRLRKIGVSDREISIALGIPEDAPVFQE